jgi:DNA invertase Pin-like site-specific DNA recombinase
MAVFGYCMRHPEDPEQPEEDTKNHRVRIKGYAMLHGLALEKCVVEFPAQSAKPFGKRRRARKLLENLQPGDVIITPGIERIFMGAADAVRTIEELQDAGVALHVVDWGDDVLAAPLCANVWPLLQYFARAERRAARQRAANPASPRVKGRHRGRTPFGYELEDGKRRKNEKEQEAILIMADLKAGGRSYAAIAAEIEERLGYSFSHMGVKKILERKRKADEAARTADVGEAE